MAAVWIAAHLADAVPLPDPPRMRQAVVDQLAFMVVATNRHHCRCGKIIPCSLHNIDEVLEDLDLNISKRVRASHWLNPVDPTAYRGVTPALVDRLKSRIAQRPVKPDMPEAGATTDLRKGSTAEVST
jgi:hypothetical protein